MTTPERIHASRLIEKIDKNRDYAEKIGLSDIESADELMKQKRRSMIKKHEKKKRERII